MVTRRVDGRRNRHGGRPLAQVPHQLLTDKKVERRLLAAAIAESGRDASTVRVLEAGCGQKWPVKVEGVGLHITGVDYDADAMRIRREQHGDLDVEIVGDLRTVELPAASFDVAYCSFVLEHVVGAEGVLDRLVSATRPGGRIVVRVPDGDTVYGFLVKHSPHRSHVLFKRYVEGFKDAGKPGHAPYPTVYEDIVSVRGLREYAERRGLRIVLEYGTNFVLRNFRALGPLVDAGLHGLSRLSRGRMLATHNDICVVMQRPAEDLPAS